jgi:hypothetical protein
MKYKVDFDKLILLVVTIVLSFHLAPPLAVLGHDKQIFIYGGYAIWKGEMPYKDFFDHKPPLIYIFNAIGWTFQLWGIFICSLLLKYYAALMLLKTAKKYNIEYAIVIPLVFLITLLTPFILSSGYMTREHTASLLAILGSVILLYPGRNYVLYGLLGSLIFHMQQEEFLVAVPLLSFAALNTNEKFNITQVILRGLKMFAGFLIPVVCIVLWMQSQDALNDYWNQAYWFNVSSYSMELPISFKFEKLIFCLFHTRFLFLIPLFMLLHLAFIFKKKTIKAEHLLLLFSFAALFITKLSLGRMVDQHYFNGAPAFHVSYFYLNDLCAFMAFSVLFLMYEVQHLSLFSRTANRIAYSLFVVGLLALFWKNSINFLFERFNDPEHKIAKTVKERISDVHGKAGQFFVIGNPTYLYINYQSDIIAPAKWLYTTQYEQQIKGFDADGKLIDEIFFDLNRYKTKYIMDFYSYNPVINQQFQLKWTDYLRSNYTPVLTDGHYILFQRK